MYLEDDIPHVDMRLEVMSNITVGILLLIAGNLFASLSDPIAVKLLNGEVPPLRKCIIFFVEVDILMLITPLWLSQSKAQRRLQQAKVHLNPRTADPNRLVGCMVVAITHMSLATANAVFT